MMSLLERYDRERALWSDFEARYFAFREDVAREYMREYAWLTTWEPRALDRWADDGGRV